MDNHAAQTNVTTSVYIQGNVNSYASRRGGSSTSKAATTGVNRSGSTGGTNIYQGDLDVVTERNIGISLTVTPRLNGTNQITLSVDASVEALLASSEVSSDATRSTTRSVSTQVTVTDGDTVILGGLIAENMIEYQPQVIPDLGQALRDRGGYVSYERLAQKIDFFAFKNFFYRKACHFYIL